MNSRRSDPPAYSSVAELLLAQAEALLPEVRTVHGAAQRLWRLLGGERASEAQLRAVDLVVARLRARNALHPHAFYPDGFGESSALAVVARSIRWQQHVLLRDGDGADGRSGAEARALAEAHEATVEPVEPLLSPADSRCPDARGVARVHEGVFASPVSGLVLPARCIPPNCLQARFQLVTPLSWRRNARAGGRAVAPGGRAAVSGGGGGGGGGSGGGGGADAEADREFEDVRRAQPVAVLLAGTGEQGFSRRRQLVALPLARAGIASVILESPYYGSRRPPAQVASKLRSMVDLPLLGRMTIEETRSLVRWLRMRRGVSTGDSDGGGGGGGGGGDADAEDRYGAVVLSGVSMGGLHAAMTASLLPPSWRDVGMASWLGPPSGAAVFTRGALALGTDFAALARDADDAVQGRALEQGLQQLESLLYVAPGAVTPAVAAALTPDTADGAFAEAAAPAFASAAGGGPTVPRSAMPSAADAASLAAFFGGVERRKLERAQRQAVRLLRLTDITNFAPPARPDAAVFVTGSADAYVPAHKDTLDMWQHVREQWRGSEVRTVRGGHVTGSLFEVQRYAQTVVEIVRRLVR